MRQTKRPRRVIDHLRRLFPGRWEYRGGWWHGESFYVFGESHNYDEGRGTHTVKYVRSDTGQVIDGYASWDEERAMLEGSD